MANRIATEQPKEAVTFVRATLQANAQLIMMYWRTDRMILDAQEKKDWNVRVNDRIALDLREPFPDMKGFSASSLKNIRQFAQVLPHFPIGQQVVNRLP